MQYISQCTMIDFSLTKLFINFKTIGKIRSILHIFRSSTNQYLKFMVIRYRWESIFSIQRTKVHLNFYITPLSSYAYNRASHHLTAANKRNSSPTIKYSILLFFLSYLFELFSLNFLFLRKGKTCPSNAGGEFLFQCPLGELIEEHCLTSH